MTNKSQHKTQKPRVKKYTPQQVDFALRYFLPSSPTFGNALQSALKAGFSESYARNITAESNRSLDWFDKIIQEITGKPEDKANLVAKAKKVLSRSLDSPDDKLAQDTAKFIAKTDPEFSEKQDITSGGEKIDIPVALVEFADGKSKRKTSS
ncbi:MAG: hypothetical protein Q4A30_02010 [Candidatus Saccharibacteria bacterium]|nr:hypothetical protein [Candidatus Saccharibacteria bacterium]